MKDTQIRAAIQELLARREWPSTICPSEVARAVAPGDWRPLMPQIRSVAIAMAKNGDVEIRQKGQAVLPDAPLRGPIRLGRSTR